MTEHSPNNFARFHLLGAFILCSIAWNAGYSQSFPNGNPFSPPRAQVQLLLTLENRDSIFFLPHQFITPGTDTLLLDSEAFLRRSRDYTIDERWGRAKFDSLFIRSLSWSAGETHLVNVRYLYFPFQFQESYFHRKLILLSDSARGETLKVAKPRSTFGLGEIFGENLQKSGSIVRGFTIGSNRDLSLNSGLRMQLAGKITNDIEVVAALTDENTPIQPEGTTQTLQEFDKVFVEIRGTDFAATLGDFNIDFKGSEFANLNRKLQGARGTGNYHLGNSNGMVSALVAVPRGKYNTNQFLGVEGVQGPYRLTGNNNERLLIIIAGTERVYIDGELQTRGETNDYIIDYSTGELTFTARKLITSASRINVDFEYADRQYSRTLLAAQTQSEFLDKKARLSFSYFRESDDPNSPIEFSISDSARLILESAGDDRFKAVMSGVTEVDSNGFYLIDSAIVSGTPVYFYRYAPGDRDAKFRVSFSSVGFGQGDYVRQSVGVFVWKGKGEGDYLPIRLLPLPQSSQLIDVQLNVAPLPGLVVSGEFGRSLFDANRFSGIDDEDNAGQAYNFNLAYSPTDVRLSGAKIGAFDLKYRERFVENKFITLDRTNEIEFDRRWGIVGGDNFDERLREASLKYTPQEGISIGTGYGTIKRGEVNSSTRNDGHIRLNKTNLPSADYFIESVRSKENLGLTASNWLRQRGSTAYTLWKLKPSFRFETEKRRVESLSQLSLAPGSFGYNVFAPGLAIENLGNMSASSLFEWRADDTFNEGNLTRESRSFTQKYGWKLAEWNSLASNLDVTLRNKSFTQTFREKGNADIRSVLVRNQTRYSPLNRGVDADLYYQVTTERSSKLERLFVRVTKGNGNYRYLGDLNNNGIADENEFIQTRFDGDFIAITQPTDELVPVIDLKTSLRVRFVPSRFISPDDGLAGKLASVLSTETYIRIEEKSSETDLKQIYLLHLSRFQKDSTTLSGSRIFTQDIHLFEGKSDFSSRLRFSERKGMNKLSSSIERNYTRERSIRLRWQLVKEIANQVDYVQKWDRVSSTELSNRLRDIASNSIAFDVSYRPEQRVELGMRFEAAEAIDGYPPIPLTSNLNTQSLRFVYAFQGAGQARVEAGREEVILDAVTEQFPFELTGGRVPGKTWVWRLSFDYRITSFVQASMNYDGRTEGGRVPVHTARAEVRAFF